MTLDQWIGAVAVGLGVAWILSVILSLALYAWTERRRRGSVR